MRRIAPVALAVLLLAVPAAEAAASGARTPIAVTCDATSDCLVEEVAIVPSTSAQCSTATSPTPSGAPCRILAGGRDGQVGFAGDRSDPVWTLWNLDGSTRQARSADPTGCPNTPPALDDCDTDVTEVSISGTGTRIAVASRVNMNTYTVQVFDDTGALRAYHNFANMVVNDIAIDPAGTRVAVGVTTTPTADPHGAVHLLDASSNNAVWATPYPTPAPVTTVDLTNSVLAAGAGAMHLRFLVPGTTDYKNDAIQGTVNDVDVSTHGMGWSVAGHSSGFFVVYSSSPESGRKQPSVPDFQKREGGETTSANAVAIRDDATMFAVGHEGGHLRLYSLDPDSAPEATVTLLADKEGLGGIDSLAFSADGRYLLLQSENTLRFYYTGNSLLEEMWTDTRDGIAAVDSVAVDGRGEHVVAAVGETVVVYDAIHRIVATVGTATHEAGVERTYDVVYRNDGNRAERLSLSAQPPAGVQTQVEPSEITLLPGATRTVTVRVDVPATWQPGTLRIPVRAAINGGDDGTPVANLDLAVPTAHELVLEADGPASVGANGGGPAVFDITARNDGNVVEDVTLRVTDLAGGSNLQGWTATITPPDLVLNPGATADVSVSLQPPPGLANGARLDVRLTHDGAEAQSLDLTATVGAVFNVKVTAPVGTIVNPGVTALVNLTVRNDGNTRDGAVVAISALPSGWLGGFINGQSEFDVQDLEPCSTNPGACSRVVQMTLRAPADHSSTVPVQVTLTATSVGDETKASTARLLVTVQTPSTSSSSTTGDDGDGNGIPGPAPLLVMLALALAALASRRRT